MKKRLKFYYHTLLDVIEKRKKKHCAVKASRINNEVSYVIMFHHVNDKYDTSISPTCQCTVEEFCKILDDLNDKGKAVCSLDEFYKLAENEQLYNNVIISFDDIPENVYTKAYPILKERNIPFCIFITTGFINKKGYISLEQLRELSQDPLCTVGAHTATHPFLKDCKDYCNEELLIPKQILETIIQKPIDFFAYPYGTRYAVSRKNITLVEKSRIFKCAFSTTPSTVNKYSFKDKFFIPRINCRIIIDNIIK